MKRLTLFLAIVFLSSFTAAHAQLGVYAGYTASKLDLANTNWSYGPTFGAYFDGHHFPLINFGLDARVSIIDSDSYTHVTTGLAGPRAVVHLPVVPLRPYAELVAGVAHASYGQGVAQSTSTNAAFGFALGADLAILPHLDWRVIDYSYTRLQTTDSTYDKSFTTGLVFRIPLS